jgi:hypothetical protein
LKLGETANIVTTFDDQAGQFKVIPGVSLEMKLHTASGKDYPKLFVLQGYTSISE